MARRIAHLLGLLGVGLGFAAFLPAETARASCSAPTTCTVSDVVVRSCAATDPEKDPQIARFLAELRKQHEDARARALIASYRGVLVEVAEQHREVLACKRPLPKKSYDEAGFSLTGGSLLATPAVAPGVHRYFVPSHDARACELRFPAGRRLRMHAAASCCDGDPGPPCLMSR